MPVPRSALVTTIFTGLWFAFSLLQHPAYGESNETGASQQKAQQFDSINFQGRAEFEISDPSQVPAQIGRAAAESGCNYKAGIKEVPLHFINTEQRRFVLVCCWGVVGTHQVFELSDLRQPKLVAFPFLAREMGFGATPRPGWIIWRRDAGLFEAVTGTDTCPSSRIRHVYKLGATEGFASAESGFVLVRVDVMEDGCGNGPWSTVWEAPNWPKAVVVR
jgi:hypothetical protein